MMTFPRCLKLPLLLAGLLLAVTAKGAERTGVSEYDILRSFPPGRLAALSAGDKPDAHGFTGGNRANGFWIEVGPQRGSCRGVIAAVVAGDLASADDCWRGIDVAFAHQRADGGFDAIVKPNGSTSGKGPAAVETAYFFLQELGRAVLVIRQSPYEHHFHERLVALTPKLRRAADFILAGYDTIIPKVGHTVNRVIIAAKAFGLCGLALGDPRMLAKSRQLIAHALTLRDKEGVFIERGGRDSSYNVVSILFGQVLALHLDLPEFEAALPAAVAWQVTRILPSGEVDARGNTRTGVGLEPDPFSGKSKGVNYTEVAMALTLYGTLHHDKSVMAAADRVSAYRQKMNK
ncbi:MAG: hypothetical protein KBA71_05860 [Opitutaceae bacterium]|nr:hypothetical protein [Opitutaceae bacterium]